MFQCASAQLRVVIFCHVSDVVTQQDTQLVKTQQQISMFRVICVQQQPRSNNALTVYVFTCVLVLCIYAALCMQSVPQAVVYATDFSESMVSLTRERLQSLKDDVSNVLADTANGEVTCAVTILYTTVLYDSTGVSCTRCTQTAILKFSIVSVVQRIHTASLQFLCMQQYVEP
jgi:hypothetical protein